MHIQMHSGQLLLPAVFIFELYPEKGKHMIKTCINSQKLYEALHPTYTETHTAQLVSNGLCINMYGFFDTLIREAARCNNYGSDVIFDIDEIRERFASYQGGTFEPIWIAFRRHGVDGTSYILSRMKNYDSPLACLYREYFVVYSIAVQESEYNGFYDVIISTYNT